MKKLTALVLALLMLASLCACSTAQTNGSAEGGADYVFKKGDVAIAIDADLSPIVKALGDYIYYDEAPSCAHEGKSKYYTYAGIDIESYPKDGKDLVYMIALIDDTVSTKEGLRVGDAREDVIEIYGEPTEDGGKALLYKRTGMCLNVILGADGKKVSQIQYMHLDAIEG